MRRELIVWLRLKHPTMVPLLRTAKVESPFPALISQWMPSGTLYMYLMQGTITDSVKDELASLLLASSHSKVFTNFIQ